MHKLSPKLLIEFHVLFILQALATLKIILQLRKTDASAFKDFCALDKALERMRLQLEKVMEDEDQRDYAKDVEILRREVELFFHKKLEMVCSLFFLCWSN